MSALGQLADAAQAGPARTRRRLVARGDGQLELPLAARVYVSASRVPRPIPSVMRGPRTDFGAAHREQLPRVPTPVNGVEFYHKHKP